MIGIIRGLSRHYASGMEHRELHIRKRYAQDIKYVDGQGVDIELKVDGEIYRGTLRASKKLDVLWISPKVFLPNGPRTTLAVIFQKAGFDRNERVAVNVAGKLFRISKQKIGDDAILAALARCPERLRLNENTDTQALADISECSAELNTEVETTRTALIEARLGQGQFRNDLLHIWEKGCAVTNCTVSEVLTASHIKPWRESTNQERLDGYNGLLLTSTLDRLFDTGLISFDKQGRIMISESVSTDQRDSLGLERNLRLRRFDQRHGQYLAWHRKKLFRKK